MIMQDKNQVIVGLDLGLKRVGYVKVAQGVINEAGVITINDFKELYQWALKNLQNCLVIVEVPVPFGRPPTTVLQMSAQVGIIWTVVERMVCISRPDIKMVLLGTTKAKDKDIRDCLRHELENYRLVLGKGVKLKGDAWSALAAVTAFLKDPSVGKRNLSFVWNKLVSKYEEEVRPNETAEVIDDEEAFRKILEGGDE
jgi:hypothetical protein